MTRPSPTRPAVTAGGSTLDQTRFLPANRRRLSAPGLRAFLAIADLWDLTEGERLLILGSPARSTFHGWARIARQGGGLLLPADTLVRISAVLGIHKALGILFQAQNEAIGWLRGPHNAQPFGGQPPMALIVSGTQDGLMAVRRFLDATRGGTFMAPNEADHADPLTDADILLA